MEVARLGGRNIDITAIEFSHLSAADKAKLSELLICVKCHKMAWYNKESTNGHKPHFAGKHLPGCTEAGSGGSRNIDGIVLRHKISMSKDVIRIRPNRMLSESVDYWDNGTGRGEPGRNKVKYVDSGVEKRTPERVPEIGLGSLLVLAENGNLPDKRIIWRSKEYSLIEDVINMGDVKGMRTTSFVWGDFTDTLRLNYVSNVKFLGTKYRNNGAVMIASNVIEAFLIRYPNIADKRFIAVGKIHTSPKGPYVKVENIEDIYVK